MSQPVWAAGDGVKCFPACASIGACYWVGPSAVVHASCTFGSNEGHLVREGLLHVENWRVGPLVVGVLVALCSPFVYMNVQTTTRRGLLKACECEDL